MGVAATADKGSHVDLPNDVGKTKGSDVQAPISPPINATPTLNESSNLEPSAFCVSDLEAQRPPSTVLEVNTNDGLEHVISPKEARLLVVCIAMAIYLVTSNTTMLATALSTITSVFEARDLISWVITSYMFAFNALQPLYGKLADIFGRRTIFTFAFSAFTLGTALCGASQNIEMLIVSRTIQGIGGGGIFGLSLIIIADVFPLEERPKYNSVVMAVFGVSSVLGPIIAGALVDHGKWRWAFFITVPIGLLVVIASYFLIRIPHQRSSLSEKLRRIDYLGVITEVGSVVALLLALSWGGTKFAWHSATIILLIIGTFLLFAAFLFIETRIATDPLIPPRIMTRRSIPVYLCQFCTGWNFYSALYYVPIYYHVIEGITSTKTGLHLLPFLMLLVAFSIGTAALLKWFPSFRPLLVGATIIEITGSVMLMQFSVNSNTAFKLFALGLLGIGIGITFQVNILASQAVVEKRDVAVSTALIQFMNTFGGGISIAVCSTIFNNRIESAFLKLKPDVYAEAMKYGVLKTFSAIHTLPEAVRTPVLAAYMESIRGVFVIGVPIACIALIATFFISGSVRGAKVTDKNECPLNGTQDDNEKAPKL